MGNINYRAAFLVVLGSWVLFDGLISFAMYQEQSWYEQTIRIYRMVTGFLIVLVAPPIGLEWRRWLRIRTP